MMLGTVDLTVHASGALFTFCIFLHTVSGSHLPLCISGKLTINEKLSSTSILCDQLGTAQVVFILNIPATPSVNQPLGFCNPNGSCQADFPGQFDLSRSGTSSTVTIAQSQYRSIENAVINCQETNDPTSCNFDLFYPADVSCTVNFTSGTWTLDVSCDVAKTYSSRGSYWWTGYRGTTLNMQADVIRNQTYSPTDHSQSPYKTGTFSFSASIFGLGTTLPSDNQFYFRFDVYPGPTTVVRGPLTLERPVRPTAGCPVIVRENIPFTCTCYTAKIGQPTGQLQWSGGATGTVNVIGNYGASNLTLPNQTLTRQDHGVTKLTCEVQWAEGSYKDFYTANVGFPASKTNLTVNSAQPDKAVNETDTVTLTCFVTGGNPASNTVSLTGPLSLSVTGNSLPLTHSLGPATCNMTGDYVCTTNNGYGDTTGSASLAVNCRPQGTYDIGHLNFIDVPAVAQFDVTAYPTPTQVTFSFLALLNSTDFSQVNPQHINMTGSCKENTTVVYQSTCTVTIYNMTTDQAAGNYRVTVKNTQGQGNFSLQVLYKAPVTESPPSHDTTSGNNDIIIGVVVAVAAVVAVVVVILVILIKRRKRKGASHSKNTHSNGKGASHSKNTHSNVLISRRYEGETSPPSPAISTTPIIDGPLTCTPAGQTDVYAQVNKTQKTKKMNKTEKTKGGRIADQENEYANMDSKGDQTKKRKKPSPAPASAVESEDDKEREVNAQGQIYVKVDFTGVTPSSKPPLKPKPKEPEIIYSDIAHSMTAPPK